MQHYMRAAMRLLIVLSAFLAALVGLGAGVPAAASPASEMCASTVAKAERGAPQARAGVKPVAAVSDRLNAGPIAAQDTPVRPVPLYAERLRV